MKSGGDYLALAVVLWRSKSVLYSARSCNRTSPSRHSGAEEVEALQPCARSCECPKRSDVMQRCETCGGKERPSRFDHRQAPLIRSLVSSHLHFCGVSYSLAVQQSTTPTSGYQLERPTRRLKTPRRKRKKEYCLPKPTMSSWSFLMAPA